MENEALAQTAADSKFFWLSHEHPDHFSIEFFKKFQPRHAKILFQWTRDKRVVSYFRNNGYEVIEIGHGEVFNLSNNETLMVRRCYLVSVLSSSYHSLSRPRQGLPVLILRGLEEVEQRETHDVAMTSENLNFIFLNEFGYDTLTVNGRFEAEADSKP